MTGFSPRIPKTVVLLLAVNMLFLSLAGAVRPDDSYVDYDSLPNFNDLEDVYIPPIDWGTLFVFMLIVLIGLRVIGGVVGDGYRRMSG